MRPILLFLTLSNTVAAVSLALPDANMRVELTAAGEGRLVPDDSWNSRTVSTKLWDNWSDQSDGGVSIPHSRYRVGGSEVGEVCFGAHRAGGRIGDMGITLYNYSTSGNITRYRQTQRVYSTDGVLLTTVTVLVGGFIPAGTGAFIRSGENSLLGFYGNIDDNFLFTLQFSDITGIDIGDVGMTVGGPISAGTSPALSFNRTTGEQIDLPGDDHFMMFVHTDSVPTPAASTLLLTALPLALRRRR